MHIARCLIQYNAMTEAGVEEQKGRPSFCSSQFLGVRNYSGGTVLIQKFHPFFFTL